MTSNSDPENQLQDGFQELFTFHEHRLNVRGFGLVEWTEESRRQTDFNMQQTYISWDVKQVLLWKYDFNPNHSPKLLQHVKFSNQPNFICAIVHVPRMKVFLAAALDMTFKIFDRNLKLLESIHHEERAILQMELDTTRDIIYSSGANGISAWRLYRNTSVDKAHIMEKLYSFEDCEKWVTHMIYEPQFNKIYAIKERSVQVLSTTRRSVITTLTDVHDAPVNVVCWYERNQFYMTGCSRGEIKCWTSNFNQKSSQLSTSSSIMKSNDAPTNMFSLLHTFKGHTKAVTAIKLHPVSGLAISTSLDGFLKVLNLEALLELFSIQLGVGISGMRIINIGMHHHGILMSTTDATLKLWKITSVCDFFGVTSSKIGRLEVFENLEAELELHYRQKQRDLVMQSGGLNLAAIKLRNRSNSHSNRNSSESQSKQQYIERDIDEVNEENEEGSEDEINAHDDEQHMPDVPGKRQRQASVSYADGGSISDKILVTYSTQDLRAFTQSGQLLGRLEPEHVVEGIKDYCVSVYQKLLFCLCDGDRVLVFDLRRFTFPLVHEFNLRGTSSTSSSNVMTSVMARFNQAVSNREGNNNEGNGGGSPIASQPHQGTDGPPTAEDHRNANPRPYQNVNVAEDLGICCELVDVGPAVALRAPRFTSGGGGEQAQFKTDARGNRVPDYISSYLLIGMNNGAILFLDTLNNFEVQMNFQATNGIVVDMKYRRRQRELIVLGKDLSQTYSNIRIWRLPDMDFLGEFSNLKKVSCFSVSSSLNFFGVGMYDGNVRLFNHEPEAAKIREIVKSGESHALSVMSLCFCDDLRIYYTASLDGKVKIWDYEKRLIRTIALNLPSCAVVPNGNVGDIVMAQNHYLLTIPKRIWNEDEILETMRLEFEATANEDIPENILDEVSRQKSQSQARQQQEYSEIAPEDSERQEGRGRAMSNASNEGAGSDNELDHAQTGSSSPTQKDQLHRHSISDRRSSSRNPSKADIAADDNSTPVGRIKRNSSFQRSSGEHFVRKASISINSRRKASLSMARGSVRHNAVQLDAASPTGGTESSATAMDGSHLRGNLGGKSRESSVEQVQIQQAEMERQVNDAIEREVLLPTLQQHKYRFVSGSPPRVPLSQPESSSKSSVLRDASVASHSTHPHHPSHSTAGSGQVRFQVSMPEKTYEQEISQSYYDVHHLPAASQIASKEVLDVLHPRFLLHDKPPARMVKLEDVDRHLRQLQQKMIARNSSVTAPTGDDNRGATNSSDQVFAVENLERRSAQFGLSPRARLTLMHSSPLQSSFASGVEELIHNPSASKRSAFEAAHQQHKQLQAQQSTILNMALGMKVSQQYKQHRQSLNVAREQRMTVMKQRLSIVSNSSLLPAAMLEKAQGNINGTMLEGMSEASEESDSNSDSGSVSASGSAAESPVTSSAKRYHPIDGSSDKSDEIAQQVRPPDIASLRTQVSVRIRRSMVTFNDAR